MPQEINHISIMTPFLFRQFNEDASWFKKRSSYRIVKAVVSERVFISGITHTASHDDSVIHMCNTFFVV